MTNTEASRRRREVACERIAALTDKAGPLSYREVAERDRLVHFTQVSARAERTVQVPRPITDKVDALLATIDQVLGEKEEAR